MFAFFPEWSEFRGWEDELQRRGRFPLMRLIRFVPSVDSSENHPNMRSHRPGPQESVGLSVNVSNGGLCLLSSGRLQEGEVLRIKVPMTGSGAEAPTFAEVRWVRPLPGSVAGYAVGLRFVF